MTKTESGEIEMVLGSKQLLSVFFIVVVLLGVFFTIGYIVGRNSNPPQVVETPRIDSRPVVSDSPSGAPVEISRNGVPPRDSATDAKPIIVPRADVVTPTEPKPDPIKPEAARNVVPEVLPKQPKPEAKPVEKAEKPAKPAVKEKAEKREDKEKSTAKISKGAPRAGHYLQLSAIPEKEATLLASVLRNKNFSVHLASANKEDLRRVLVGPVAEKKDLTKLRESLTDAGFDGKKAIPRKY